MEPKKKKYMNRRLVGELQRISLDREPLGDGSTLEEFLLALLFFQYNYAAMLLPLVARLLFTFSNLNQFCF